MQLVVRIGQLFPAAQPRGPLHLLHTTKMTLKPFPDLIDQGKKWDQSNQQVQ